MNVADAVPGQELFQFGLGKASFAADWILPHIDDHFDTVFAELRDERIQVVAGVSSGQKLGSTGHCINRFCKLNGYVERCRRTMRQPVYWL